MVRGPVSLISDLILRSADDIIYDHQFAPEDALGLDHLDKSNKSRATGEKAIVIRG